MNDSKPWYLSRTVWGALIAIAASITSTFGFTLSEADQNQIAETVLQIVGAFGALFALYGRLSASQTLR